MRIGFLAMHIFAIEVKMTVTTTSILIAIPMIKSNAIQECSIQYESEPRYGDGGGGTQPPGFYLEPRRHNR